jgi:flagellar hook-length control protein FliK
MPENFLSFIANSVPTAVEPSAESPVATRQESPQASDFNSILVKEQIKIQSNSASTEATQLDIDEAVQDMDGAVVDTNAAASTTSEAPVALPTVPTNGNLLPELSIHSRALQVGRVILTTASPRVSEESLSQFARAQGAVVPESAMGANGPIGQESTGRAQTQGVLQGLIGRQSAANGQSEWLPQAGNRPKLATSPEQVTDKSNSATVDSQKRFLERAQRSAGDPVNREPAAVLEQVTDKLNSATVDPRMRFLNAVQQSSGNPVNSDPAAVDKLTPTRETADPWQKTSEALGGRIADNAEMQRDHSVMKNMLASSHVVQAEGVMEKSDPLFSSLESDTQSSSQQPPNPHAAASAQSIPQSGLAQAPITNTAISLGDALMSADPAQMQSRLQPYQVWAQRFGEVLAQKLALAVKDGNWTVKLNLNPAALGPVAVELQVREGGIEGQIAANDANVRQLISDSMPRLRHSLEALLGENAGVNIELGDGKNSQASRDDSQEIEVSMDLFSEELIPSEQELTSGNILRDGLNVFV